MHKQLEDYLAQIERNLGSLPQQRRSDELKEMRQHLLSAVTANKDDSQSEEVAIANAIASFGTPDEVSASVLGAWHRHLWKQGLKMFWKMEGIWSALLAFHLLFLSPQSDHPQMWLRMWCLALVLNAFILLGPPYWRLHQKIKVL